MMGSLLARLDRWLAAHRPDYYAQLQPGASEEVLNAFEIRFGLKLPTSFRALYRWRDGQREECSASLHNNRMFSSLEAIAETKELLDGMIGSDFEDPKWWRKGWVPFLANGGGDHLCVDLATEDGGTPGHLIAFGHDWGPRPIEFNSLDALLQHLVESMDNAQNRSSRTLGPSASS